MRAPSRARPPSRPRRSLNPTRESFLRAPSRRRVAVARRASRVVVCAPTRAKKRPPRARDHEKARAIARARDCRRRRSRVSLYESLSAPSHPSPCDLIRSRPRRDPRVATRAETHAWRRASRPTRGDARRSTRGGARETATRDARRARDGDDDGARGRCDRNAGPRGRRRPAARGARRVRSRTARVPDAKVPERSARRVSEMRADEERGRVRAVGAVRVEAEDESEGGGGGGGEGVRGGGGEAARGEARSSGARRRGCT